MGILLIIGLIVVVVVICVIAAAIEEVKRKEYRDYAKRLNSSGQKVVYYNETTGTIRYRGKDKRIHSESLYRGYRSHWRG